MAEGESYVPLDSSTMSCAVQSAKISGGELDSEMSFMPAKGMETLLMTAVLGFMRPMPATHKQEVDALGITTHLIRLFKDHVRLAALSTPSSVSKAVTTPLLRLHRMPVPSFWV